MTGPTDYLWRNQSTYQAFPIGTYLDWIILIRLSGCNRVTEGRKTREEVNYLGEDHTKITLECIIKRCNNKEK